MIKETSSLNFEFNEEFIYVKNIQCLLETRNKYELKIKLNLLGLSFRKLTSDICYNTDSNKSIKSSKNFTLKSSYEN